MWVYLQDGRAFGLPLTWFPSLKKASDRDRENVQLSPFGLHWESLDEDLSVAGLLSQARSFWRKHRGATKRRGNRRISAKMPVLHAPSQYRGINRKSAA
ncbi:DUF2442 domain-containing protein [Dinoroseobacter sp. PD6]|nr:DUF2442 domain-containing protein [Dinoroseobacter sp. PD6]MDD9718485.1 DUF2442 domain-containing protein [Dinoroseobacter sp. PD6]